MHDMCAGQVKVSRVRDAASGEETEVAAREVVNAAGLYAPAVAATMAGLPQRLVPRAYFARGHYFSLTGSPGAVSSHEKKAVVAGPE